MFIFCSPLCVSVIRKILISWREAIPPNCQCNRSPISGRALHSARVVSSKCVLDLAVDLDKKQLQHHLVFFFLLLLFLVALLHLFTMSTIHCFCTFLCKDSLCVRPGGREGRGGGRGIASDNVST